MRLVTGSRNGVGRGMNKITRNTDSLLKSGAVFAWSDDLWIIASGEGRWLVQPDPRRASFYAPDFFLSGSRPWFVYPEAGVVAPDELAQLLRGERLAREWRRFDEAAFRAVFRRVQTEIRGGELQKAVPAVFEHSPGAILPEERARALRSMANLPSGLMPYGFWGEEGGVMGASPEVLFESDGAEIRTMAVAGTARGGSAPGEMLEDPKERSEHQLVLEDIASQIAQLGAVKIGATRSWRIGMLSHLRTDLSVKTGGVASFDDLVELLHPTPAVGTSPRRGWRNFIRGIDSEERGGFAAPFGLLLPDGRFRCLVSIRHVQWDRERARCGAGCGIVEGSRVENEVAELRLKLAATRENLGF